MAQWAAGDAGSRGTRCCPAGSSWRRCRLRRRVPRHLRHVHHGDGRLRPRAKAEPGELE
ncbi:hypothetical protein NKH77_30865 [Streptomyces sp. M19]